MATVNMAAAARSCWTSRARAACSLPVIRKDFTVSERDVLDARIMGADCVLLIAAALDRGALSAFHTLAVDIGLDVEFEPVARG